MPFPEDMRFVWRPTDVDVLNSYEESEDAGHRLAWTCREVRVAHVQVLMLREAASGAEDVLVPFSPGPGDG